MEEQRKPELLEWKTRRFHQKRGLVSHADLLTKGAFMDAVKSLIKDQCGLKCEIPASQSQSQQLPVV